MSHEIPNGEAPAFIEQNCSECGKPLQIPVQFAGQFGTCRHCGATILAEHASTTRKPVAPQKQSSRLLSLDVLRGFDMFWIIGADSVCEAIEKACGGECGAGTGESNRPPVAACAVGRVCVLRPHLSPVRVYRGDVGGLFADQDCRARRKLSAFKRIARRAALLLLLGAVYDSVDCYYSGGMAEVFRENLLCGVLQRMAVCYLVTGTLICLLRLRGLIAVFVVVLIGYWATLSFIPAPGEAHVSFERGRNIIQYIDLMTPPYYDIDPESFMTSFGAICTCLLGAFAAFAIRDGGWDENEQAKWFFLIGLAMVIAGYAWGMQIPIIKRLWTPSYVR